MYDTHAHSVASFAVVDQLALSLAAARAHEHKQAVHERRLAAKVQRQHRRAVRRGQEAYTTAV